MAYYAGLDIGGTKCAASLASARDDEIVFLGQRRMDTRAEEGPEQALTRLFALLDALLQAHPDAARELKAIGVSCGGPLDAARGLILSPPNLPGWDAIDIVDQLRGRYGRPAFLQNDANACALVEGYFGAARGVADAIFLTMGTGLGAGIIADGRLLEGACGMAGEIGHWRLADDGPEGFGKRGSLEGFVGGGGIAEAARDWSRRRAADGHPPAWLRDGLALDTLSVKQLADYARQGDPDALALFDAAGERLGQGLALLMDAFNPAVIVIGSIFARCEAWLRPAMERVVEREALDLTRRACRVVPARFDEDLGDRAAITVAVHGLRASRAASPARSPADDDAAVAAALDDLLRRYPALAAMRAELRAAYDGLAAVYARDGRLLVAGNGGSAADAGHVVGELMKGFLSRRPLPADEAAALDAALARVGIADGGARLQGALPAIDLTAQAALLSAFANDVDPAFVFAQQVVGYGRPGDAFWGFSTSGNSANVLAAAAAARARGLFVLAMTGPGGGRLADVADVTLRVPGANTPEIQELHLPIYHTLCQMLELRFFSTSSA